MLGAAVQRHRASDFAAAESIYRQILAIDPEHADALYLLGVMAGQQGRQDDAVDLITRALSVGPDLAERRYNLGIALQAIGRGEAAVAAYRAAAELQPDYVEAWANLGAALHATGRDDEALIASRRAVSLRPNSAQGQNNLGAAYRALGREEEALGAFRQAIALQPSYPAAHRNLGAALRSLGRLEDSLAATRRALELKPDFVDAWLDLGVALHALERNEAAIDAFDRALALQPANADAHNNRGAALHKLDRIDEALAAYRRAAELTPGVSDIWGNIAVTLMQAGRTDEARSAVRRALAIDPASAHAWYVASDLKTFAPGDLDIERMEELLAPANAGRMRVGDRIDLEFALGKAWMDAGDADRAFAHLDEGNRRVRGGFSYSVDADLGRLEAIAGTVTAEWLGRFTGAGEASDLPVVIVGMVRSGTSLVEQILASHPEVHGAGELTALAHAVAAAVGPNRTALGLPGLVSTLTAEDLAALGRAYVDQLAALGPGKRRVVDKQPANFQAAGLISRALPNARIIHCRRDPVDTCLSIYAKRFVGRQDYAYDLGELGRYYRGYERLMDHWRGVLPADRFVEVDYEDVVGDLEAQARRLVAFCGLDWDPACLEFHRTRRPVRTASANQVRQTLYATSVGRWKPYEHHLGPLLAALR